MVNKSLLINISIFAISIFLFFALFELFLRFSQAGIEVKPLCIYGYDENLGYVLQPNLSMGYTHPEFNMQIKTNSLGFRDDEPQKSLDYRVVGVGDSFTFGHGIDNNQAYLNVAEVELQQIFNIEIMNEGVGGYTNTDAFNHFKKFGSKLSPQILVFAVFLGNDVIDNLIENQNIYYADGCLKRRENTQANKDVIFSIREFFYQNFYTVRFFSNVRQIPLVRDFLISVGATSKGEYNLNFELKKKTPSDKALEAIGKTTDIIGQVNDYCKERNITLLVFLMPDKYQIQTDLLYNEAKNYGVDLNALDSENINKELIGFLEQNNISYLDSTNVLKEFYEKHPDEPLYYEKDSHANSKAHALQGHALAEKIKSILLQNN